MIGYVDRIEAMEYLTQRYAIDFTQEQLDKYLYRALDKIESLDIRNSGIVMKFPRMHEEKVHEIVKQAQMLEAYAIHLTQDEGINNNVKSKSSLSISITYGDGELQGVEFKSALARDIMRKFVRKSFRWG